MVAKNGVEDKLEVMVRFCNGVRKFLTHTQENGSALILKDDRLDEFSRSPYSTAIRVLFCWRLENR